MSACRQWGAPTRSTSTPFSRSTRTREQQDLSSARLTPPCQERIRVSDDGHVTLVIVELEDVIVELEDVIVELEDILF